MPRRVLITGGAGQLGQALASEFDGALAVTRSQLDLADLHQVRSWHWHEFDVVLNAAGYTAVDLAETPQGRIDAWQGNVTAASNLCRAARAHGVTVVHFSSEYVFDGSALEHDEAEPFSPLGVYGQTKAAADAVVGGLDEHYILRPTGLIGSGRNFVRTMHALAVAGSSPRVVDDQVGRLTFATDLARATHHLLEVGAEHGTYNCSNAGPSMSWHQVARRVFELAGRDPDDVLPVSTKEYDAAGDHAPRPLHSTLDLAKLIASGFSPPPADQRLVEYVADLTASA